jgi:hypothetical protein
MKRALLLALVVSVLPLTACGGKHRKSSGVTEVATATGGVTATTSGSNTNGSGTGSLQVLARVADYGDPSGDEQELLELMQRARKDPAAEGARLNAAYHLSLNFSGYAAMPPLSHNGFLHQAASAHTADMAARQFYGHVNPDGVGPNGRILATQYDLNTWFGTNPAINLTENLGMGSGAGAGNTMQTPQGVHDTFMIDANVVGTKHRQLILGVGQHAPNREVGVSYLRQADTEWCCEEFAYTNTNKPFVVGVAYDDRDQDGVCRSGEGTPGVTVTLSHASGFQVSTTTKSAGGYAFEVFYDGTYTLTVGGQSTQVVVQGQNLKVDLKSGAITR